MPTRCVLRNGGVVPAGGWPTVAVSAARVSEFIAGFLDEFPDAEAVDLPVVADEDLPLVARALEVLGAETFETMSWGICRGVALPPIHCRGRAAMICRTVAALAADGARHVAVAPRFLDAVFDGPRDAVSRAETSNTRAIGGRREPERPRDKWRRAVRLGEVLGCYLEVPGAELALPLAAAPCLRRDPRDDALECVNPDFVDELRRLFPSYVDTGYAAPSQRVYTNVAPIRSLYEVNVSRAVDADGVLPLETIIDSDNAVRGGAVIPIPAETLRFVSRSSVLYCNIRLQDGVRVPVIDVSRVLRAAECTPPGCAVQLVGEGMFLRAVLDDAAAAAVAAAVRGGRRIEIFDYADYANPEVAAAVAQKRPDIWSVARELVYGGPPPGAPRGLATVRPRNAPPPPYRPGLAVCFEERRPFDGRPLTGCAAGTRIPRALLEPPEPAAGRADPEPPAFPGPLDGCRMFAVWTGNGVIGGEWAGVDPTFVHEAPDLLDAEELAARNPAIGFLVRVSGSLLGLDIRGQGVAPSPRESQL